MNQREMVLVLLGSVLVALFSARPYAGGWNDSSRLAAVECLVDYGTLSIDQSIFVDPAHASNASAKPYAPDDRMLTAFGTLDKVMVQDRYYSDKPMVPAVLMAGGYQLLQWATGLKASSRPDWFAYAMTVISSGLAYVVAVLAVYTLGRNLLPQRYWAVAVTASFGLGTAALTYTRHTSSHECLLGIAAALMLGLHVLVRKLEGGVRPWALVAGLGVLAGLGYTMEFAAGPLLLLSTAPLIAWRLRVLRSQGVALAAVYVLAAAPFVILHHLLNYLIGGTILPVNMVPAYLAWPGSPFGPASATGHWHHGNLARGMLYALELLFGKKGFLLHQPVLILALAAGILLLVRERSRLREWPEMVFCLLWSGATWLIYAWGSSNQGGLCATIRWFVPLLAPGYYLLMVVLRYLPGCYRQFLVLAASGLLLSTLMWWYGPWMPHMVPGYWFILAGTLAVWSLVAFRGEPIKVVCVSEKHR
ncbi:MAG TPA: hypothetical protein DCE18_10475 [Syntrophobacteraceae bacterium]|nr:hypothetical protein [Syntrophobacteraceae bacterium]